MNNPVFEKNEEWTSIVTYEKWKSLDDIFLGFRDGVIKDLHFSNGEYIDESLNMIYSDLPTIWMLIQFQNEKFSSIEFLLKRVANLKLDVNHELVISVKLTGKFINLYLSETGSSQITAKEILYRIPNPSLLGKKDFNYF